MKKILCLASWYPNIYGVNDGNFIQRHSRAISLFAKVHVLYVHPKLYKASNGFEENKVEVSILNEENNFVEEIVYYDANEKSFLGKYFSQYNYYNIMKRKIKHYLSVNGLPDIVHVHVPIRAGILARWMKKKYGVDYVLTEHYGIYNDVAEDKFSSRSFIYRNTVKKILRDAKKFFPVSNQIAKDIAMEVINRDYIVIPNVVDTQLFSLKTKNQKEKFRFLHVSNMIPLKNVKGIIDAAEILLNETQDFELVLVGDCPKDISDYVTTKNIIQKHISYTGVLPYSEIATQMNDADTFILNSRTENNPCVLIESLCTGLPIIATNVGGVSEIVNSENGILIESDNTLQLVLAMKQMIKTANIKYDRETISSMAREKYSYESIGKLFIKNYFN